MSFFTYSSQIEQGMHSTFPLRRDASWRIKSMQEAKDPYKAALIPFQNSDFLELELYKDKNLNMYGGKNGDAVQA